MFEAHAGEKEWFYCTACDETFLFRGSERPGFKDEDEDVRCLGCGEVLGHLRCDVGAPELLARWKGYHQGRMAHE